MREEEQTGLVPWKAYLTLTAESLLTFYLATFCMAMFFTHDGKNWLFTSVILVLLYLFIILACAKRIFEQVNAPALMLIIPIAPFLALATVVSLIPILEFFNVS